MNRRAIATIAGSLAVLGTILAPAALAGPPLLCHPFQIGSAESLPWGKDAFEKSRNYDRSKVVDDTLKLLKTEKSILVRMETLRRAAIYIDGDRSLATELLAKLSWMALDAQAADNNAWAAIAYFDAGYLAATLRQSGVDIDWKPGVSDGLTGYAWIKKAIALRPGDAEMAFGAALVAYDAGNDLYKPHFRTAVAGAEPGSNLAASIESNHVFGQKSIQEHRASLGIADANSPGQRTR